MVSKWAPKVLNATTRPPACPQPPCQLSPTLCPPVVCVLINQIEQVTQKKELYFPRRLQKIACI